MKLNYLELYLVQNVNMSFIFLDVSRISKNEMSTTMRPVLL
jgi:hypothetical protein